MNEKVQNDIDALISLENDPGKRAVLVVLQSINRSLIANTTATEQTQSDLSKHRLDFETHLKNFESHAINEEAIMNKGKGAWWVMAFVLSMVQAIAIYGWNSSRNEIESMKASIHLSEIERLKISAKIEQQERLLSK